MDWFKLLCFLLSIHNSYAQFGEIASLATSLLGGALGGGGGLGALAGAGAAGAGAAGQAGGALAQIGQLYQLAQGALQLTGTGVGVLNQASEGNWFPAVLEQTAKNSQAFMKANGGTNFGALGPKPGSGSLGPEFGTSFPAPDIDDYDENAEIPGVTKEKETAKPTEELVGINKSDYDEEETENTSTTTEISTTNTPASRQTEKEIITEPTTAPTRQIRIQLPGQNELESSNEEVDYEDLIIKNKTETESFPVEKSDKTVGIERNVITHGTKTKPVVPNLDKLLDVLYKSKLSEQEIEEIVKQVEGNRNIEKPAKYDFNANVQNIPDKKNAIRQRVTDASRIINNGLINQNQEKSFVPLPTTTQVIPNTAFNFQTTKINTIPPSTNVQNPNTKINEIINSIPQQTTTPYTPTRVLLPKTPVPVQNTQNGPIKPKIIDDRIIHYYHNGRNIVKQLVPRTIAATGGFPVYGPFSTHAADASGTEAYINYQRALQTAYSQPVKRTVTVDSDSERSRPLEVKRKPKIFESTVRAIGRQAHATRIYQSHATAIVTDNAKTSPRRLKKHTSAKRMVSGQFLSKPDRKNLLERQITSQSSGIRTSKV